jgi:hypothetical protein
VAAVLSALGRSSGVVSVASESEVDSGDCVDNNDDGNGNVCVDGVGVDNTTAAAAAAIVSECSITKSTSSLSDIKKLIHTGDLNLCLYGCTLA